MLLWIENTTTNNNNETLKRQVAVEDGYRFKKKKTKKKGKNRVLGFIAVLMGRLFFLDNCLLQSNKSYSPSILARKFRCSGKTVLRKDRVSFGLMHVKMNKDDQKLLIWAWGPKSRKMSVTMK